MSFLSNIRNWRLYPGLSHPRFKKLCWSEVQRESGSHVPALCRHDSSRVLQGLPYAVCGSSLGLLPDLVLSLYPGPVNALMLVQRFMRLSWHAPQVDPAFWDPGDTGLGLPSSEDQPWRIFCLNIKVISDHWKFKASEVVMSGFPKFGVTLPLLWTFPSVDCLVLATLVIFSSETIPH